MTLFRTILVLLLGLVLMLAVVMLRADTARLHHQVARVERETELIVQQIADREIEAARLRSPMQIWEQLKLAVERTLPQETTPPAVPPRRR